MTLFKSNSPEQSDELIVSNSHAYAGGCMLRKFMYCKKSGQQQYVFMNKIPDEVTTKRVKKKFAKRSALLAAGLVLQVFTFVSSLNIKSTRLEPVQCTHHTSHVLVDDAGIFSNPDRTENILEEYKQKTGICPVIITTKGVSIDSARRIPHDMLESEDFSDEQHLVIVYCQEDASAARNSTEWGFEAVSGDYTLRVMDNDAFAEFKKSLDTALRTSDEPTGKIFEDAFADIAENGTSMKIDVVGLLIKMLLLSLLNYLLFSMLLDTSITLGYCTKGYEYTEVALSDDDRRRAELMVRGNISAAYTYSDGDTSAGNIGMSSTGKYDTDDRY